jgi:hypothetical protein
VLEFVDGDIVINLDVGGKAFPIDAKHLMADQFSGWHLQSIPTLFFSATHRTAAFS